MPTLGILCAAGKAHEMKHVNPLRGIFLAVLAMAALAAWAQEPLDLDPYGGLKTPNFGPGPYFRIHNDGERFWFVTPDGGAFLSLGLCVVNPVGDAERGTSHQPYRENVLKQHGSVEQWASVTRDRFRAWGLNTLGAWSGPELRHVVPYTIELSVSGGLWGGIPDLFSPESERYIRERASAVDAYAGDPYLIGYYLDNELPWACDWRRLPDIFPGYVAMPPEAPGKQRLVALFKERYASVEQFARVWNASPANWDDLASMRVLDAKDEALARGDREAFVLEVARQYFKTATEALRAKDPNHLILGCRFVWAIVPAPVVQACGEYCDVVSLNHYEPGIVASILLRATQRRSMRVASDVTFKAFYDAAKKPLLITEFGFRSIDSGVPNTYPPGWLIQPKVPTQQCRADKFEACATAWMSQPYLLGYHWFQYMDEPNVGRFDGENGNYGLVNIEDNPYTEFVSRFTAVNRRVWDLHAAAK